jgi:hypothetical protein
MADPKSVAASGAGLLIFGGFNLGMGVGAVFADLSGPPQCPLLVPVLFFVGGVAPILVARSRGR